MSEAKAELVKLISEVSLNGAELSLNQAFPGTIPCLLSPKYNLGTVGSFPTEPPCFPHGATSETQVVTY